MQRLLGSYKKEGSAVAEDGCSVQEAYGDGDPNVCRFHPWEPNQVESRNFSNRDVENRHASVACVGIKTSNSKDMCCGAEHRIA